MTAALWLSGLALPLAAAPLSFVLGRRALPWLPWATGAVVLGCLAMLASALLQGQPVQLQLGGWSLPVGIRWRLDGPAFLMLGTTALVSVAVVLFAGGYLPDGGIRGRWLGFWPVLLFLWGALNSLFLAGDIFNLYVTLELSSLAAVTLVTLEGAPAALVAGMRYLLLTLVGSLSYLLGVAVLYGAYGSLDLTLLAASLQPGMAAGLALALMSAGLFAKTALFPLHVWLPPAHGHAPAPASALLSALVVMGSFYVLLRLWLELFAPALTPGLRQLAGGLGAAAVLWGSWLALVQPRLKLAVAYSTVAQLGYPLLMLPLMTGAAAAHAWAGGLYLLLAHAFAKAAMFLVAGILMSAQGHDRIAASGGLAQRFPMTLFALGLAGLTLMGLPPSGGFIAKWLLLQAAFTSGQWWWALVLLLGGLLSAAYIFRLLVPSLRDVPGRNLRPVPLRLQAAALALALVSVLMGLFAGLPVRLLQDALPA